MSKKIITNESKIDKLKSKISILEGELKFEYDDNKMMKLKTLKRRLKTEQKIFKERNK